MVQALEVLDTLEARISDMLFKNDPAYDWIKRFRSESSVDTAGNEETQDLSFSNIYEKVKGGIKQAAVISSEDSEEDDLIGLFIRAEKQGYLERYQFLRKSPEDWRKSLPEEARDDPEFLRMSNIRRDTLLQFIRRIILYDPVLALKAKDKVNLNDLFLSPDFTIEDFKRIGQKTGQVMQEPLLWWKDATIEAIAMWPKPEKEATAANVGSLKDRFKIVGGWVFNQPHKRTMTNEAWWYLLDTLKPEGNIENRFMRLCNNFSDLQTFLSFGALGMVPSPTFCKRLNAEKERNYLSLSGVVVGDIVYPHFPWPVGPVPTTKAASRQGFIKWAEVETRAYMFGAVRCEPHAFTDAFFRELRARSDKFVVITRSDLDPNEQTEQIGGDGSEVFAQMRVRTFEAPPASFANRPQGRGAWDNIRTGRDVLYGTGQSKGLLGTPAIKTVLNLKIAGWLFRFKTFPVKYFVIFDAIPNRDGKDLVRNVAWAALCAAGYGKDPLTSAKYIKASDALCVARSSDLLKWMPSAVATWEMKTMEEHMRERGLGWMFDMEEALSA
ncbi:hypothetical protein AcW1_007639 [Taiwanofungus camphoratus]|nr:hypothetical protein AcV5_007644 [Antrodia cinnamomea]KAI0953413.1 hypothetical protein AcW1_007639 [Antrodia cinnamomea]